jgi:hypothetical protein
MGNAYAKEKTDVNIDILMIQLISSKIKPQLRLSVVMETFGQEIAARNVFRDVKLVVQA